MGLLGIYLSLECILLLSESKLHFRNEASFSDCCFNLNLFVSKTEASFSESKLRFQLVKTIQICIFISSLNCSNNFELKIQT